MSERLDQIIHHPALIPVVVGALGFGGGLFVGFVLGRRPHPIEFTPEEQAELDDIRSGIKKMKAEQTESPTKVVVDEEAYKARNEFVKLVALYSGTEDPEASVTVNKETIRRSIFAEESTPEDDWDYEVELNARDHNRPYVIHRDEFFEEDEFDFHQHQLTYYNGDDKLMDEERNIVLDHVNVVGELKFGHGSGDPNVVYIRNERLKAEYEIWLDAGRYEEEIAGADPEDVTAGEIKHSAVRKFRPE